MRGLGVRRLLLCVAGALVLPVGNVWTQGPAIQKLPVGAGAIGKGPDALTPPGYEDVPRPPAFTDAVRKENARITLLVDNYTPQPAFAGQTRASKPAKIAAYDVQTAAEGLFSPWSFAFLPDGRILVSETNRGLRLLGRDGRPIRYIEGLADRLHQARAAAARRRARQGLRSHAHDLLPVSRAAQGSR